MDLVRHLLMLKPKTRFDKTQAFKHPFILYTRSTTPLTDTLSLLIKYNNRRKEIDKLLIDEKPKYNPKTVTKYNINIILLLLILLL